MKKYLERIDLQQGQSILEVMVALGAIAIVMSAIALAVITALDNTNFSKNKNLATNFAQQGMEVMRSMRNSDFNLFNSYVTGSYCLDQNSSVLVAKDLTVTNGCRALGAAVGATGQNVPPFARQVDIEKNSAKCANETKITVLVSWSDGKCTNINNLFCHTVNLASCFLISNTIPLPE